MRDGVEASIRRYCFGGVVGGAAGVVAGGFVAAGAEGSIFGGVVDGAAGVVAGGFVAAGTEGSIVWLRDQNTAATITTTITAKIAYQKRLSPKKFIATSLIRRARSDAWSDTR
jgi:hypothetical protein